MTVRSQNKKFFLMYTRDTLANVEQPMVRNVHHRPELKVMRKQFRKLRRLQHTFMSSTAATMLESHGFSFPEQFKLRMPNFMLSKSTADFRFPLDKISLQLPYFLQGMQVSDLSYLLSDLVATENFLLFF